MPNSRHLNLSDCHKPLTVLATPRNERTVGFRTKDRSVSATNASKSISGLGPHRFTRPCVYAGHSARVSSDADTGTPAAYAGDNIHQALYLIGTAPQCYRHIPYLAPVAGIKSHEATAEPDDQRVSDGKTKTPGRSKTSVSAPRCCCHSRFPVSPSKAERVRSGVITNTRPPATKGGVIATAPRFCQPERLATLHYNHFTRDRGERNTSVAGPNGCRNPCSGNAA